MIGAVGGVRGCGGEGLWGWGGGVVVVVGISRLGVRVRLCGLEEKLVLGLCRPVNGTGSPQDDCTSGRLHLRTIHILTFFDTSSKHKSLNHESKNKKRRRKKKEKKKKKLHRSSGHNTDNSNGR